MTAFTGNPGNSTTDLEAVLYLDGTIWQETSGDWAVNGHAAGSCGSVPVPLLGGFDYVQGYIATTTASTTPTTNGQYPSIEIAWLSL